MPQPRKFVLDLKAGLYEQLVAAAKDAKLPLHCFVRRAIIEKIAAQGVYAQTPNEPIHDFVHEAVLAGQCPEGCPGTATLQRFGPGLWGLTCGPLYTCPSCGSIVHSYTTDRIGSGLTAVTYCHHCKEET